MTETVVKLRGKLPKDAAIHRSAEKLYTDGKGTRGLAVVRWVVDRTEDGLDGDGVRILLEEFEVATGEHTSTAAELMAEIIEARGGNHQPGLPFDEDDRKRFTRMLEEWTAEEGHSPADVQRLWNTHFNPSDDVELHVTGPVGASPEHLREFLGYVGAIAEDPADDITSDEQPTEPDDDTAGDE